MLMVACPLGRHRAQQHVAACRYYTQRRLNRASKKLGIPELLVYDQFEDRRVGLRFCTFVTPVQDLGGGCKVITKYNPLALAHMR